jgi:CheY-like chemotaxis protein
MTWAVIAVADRPAAQGHAMAERLLIVDDEIAITRIVGSIAAELGVDFKALNTSLTAAEVFVEYQPDVVILDIVMPGKDGIDVLNDIMNSGIPTQIVLTSGLSEGYLRLGEAIARFHGRNPVRLLRKPFRHHELVEILSRF